MKKLIQGKAKVTKESLVFFGHTFNIISYKDPGKIEKECGIGRTFWLSLVGTQFEEKFGKYTVRFEEDLELYIEDSQIVDKLYNAVFNQLEDDMLRHEQYKSKVKTLFESIPYKILANYLDDDERNQFAELEFFKH